VNVAKRVKLEIDDSQREDREMKGFESVLLCERDVNLQ
jgi:hypothetical protein